MRFDSILADSLKKPSRPHELGRVFREEVGFPPLRRVLIMPLIRLLPSGAWGRLRAVLYRCAGMQIGRGTLVYGLFILPGCRTPFENISIGKNCFINAHVFLDAGGMIRMGDNVGIGHHTLIITSNHAIGNAMRRTGILEVLPVSVESGAWIAAGVTLLPGVTIGAGAVVAAGAVVTKNIPPNVLAGGVPAKVLRSLDDTVILETKNITDG